jgi:outer membrane protein insertion porin family
MPVHSSCHLLKFQKMQFKNFLRRVGLGLRRFFVLQGAWALEPFTVKDIRVEGLQRVEAGTVFASLPVRVGDTYSDEKAAASIRSLFGLGLFKDIRIEANAGVLIVIVEERPSIADVDFAGTKEFDKDVLKKRWLADIGLSMAVPLTKPWWTRPSRS